MTEIDTLINQVFSKPKPESVKVDDKLDILLSNKKRETKSVYLSHIKKFMNFIGPNKTFDKWDVRKYINHLEDKGYKPNSIVTGWFAIKLLFESKDLIWNFSKRETPEIDEDEIHQVAVSFEDLKKLIAYAKQKGFADEKVILATSSTYGLRRSEIANLKNEDVNREEHTLHIKTKKHGRSRTHLIPEQVRPYIEQFDFDKMPKSSTISIIFNQLCLASEIKREYRQGNHSIRRFLDIFLIDAGEPEIRIMDYLRWKKLSSMPQRYYKKKYYEVDREIFKVLQPILELWR